VRRGFFFIWCSFLQLGRRLSGGGGGAVLAAYGGVLLLLFLAYCLHASLFKGRCAPPPAAASKTAGEP
jgi:hypothetical protein